MPAGITAVSANSVAIVAGLNATIAVAVGCLACRFWQWRNSLRQLVQALDWIASSQTGSPQTAGYAFMQGRAQIAQTRLTLALLQTRSQQLIQTLRLIRTGRSLLRLRDRRKF